MADRMPNAAMDALVTSQLAAIETRYPGRFSSEQLEQIREQVRQLAEAAVRLRSHPLSNADEPSLGFRPAPEGG